MAMPASIRPSMGRIANATQTFTSTMTALAALPANVAVQRSRFSSTPEYNDRRPRRDNNRFRGLSSIYRSGIRFRMNIDKSEAPKPAEYKPEVQVNPNHGLWDFFYAKNKRFLTPEELAEHGRSWSVEELRHKTWEDLHKLWWVCVKEQNRLGTARKESTRLKFSKGKQEEAERLRTVRRTMRAIQHTLTERWYVWEDARKLAETDPEVDLSNEQHPFTPQDAFEHESAFVADDQEPAAEQTPPAEQASPASGFMVESPKPDNIEPSTIPPPASPEAQQTPSTKP